MFDLKRKKYFVLLLLGALSMTIGFAVLSSALSINGSTTIQVSGWDVKFQNIVADSNNNVTGTQSIVDDTTVSFSTTLSKPRDYYSFTVDVVNDGSIDAMIDSFTKTELTSEQSARIEYTVTYSDGLIINQYDKLKSNSTETIKITLHFFDDLSKSYLLDEEMNFNLSFSLNYKQSDNNASEVSHTLDDFLDKADAEGVKSSDIGRVYTINMGSTYGDHLLRVSNYSTPSECSNANFSQTACGVVLEFADVVDYRAMNSTATNVGGWPATEMRTFLNNDVYNALPSNLKNAIIDTTVLSDCGTDDANGTGPNGFYVSTDKIYLLDYAEILGVDSEAESTDIDYYERQLDYYYINNVDSRYNPLALKSEYSTNLWLRSASSRNSTFVNLNVVSGKSTAMVNTYYSTAELAASPAFRIA